MPTFALTTVTIGSNSDTISEPTLMKGTLPATEYTLGYVPQSTLHWFQPKSENYATHNCGNYVVPCNRNKMCSPKCQHNVHQLSLQSHETVWHWHLNIWLLNMNYLHQFKPWVISPDDTHRHAAICSACELDLWPCMSECFTAYGTLCAISINQVH